MAEEREKSDDIALGSEGTLVAEHSSTKKKKKKGEKLSDDDSLVKKQSKKKIIDSDSKAENSVKESTQVMADSESKVEKSKEIRADSEFGGDDAKKKKKKKTEKRKLDDTDLVAEENTDKKKKKKMKPSVVDPEVELNNKDSPMDAIKEKEQIVQGNDLSSVKDVEKKQRKKKKKLSENAESNNDVTDSKDAEVQEHDLNSVKEDDDKEQNVDSEAKGNDGEKKKRKKKKKLSENVESNNEGSKDAEKKENVDSEVEEHDLNSAKDDDDKEQNVDSEAKGNDLNSTEDGEKRKRKTKKKKLSENAETNNEGSKENVDSDSAKDDDDKEQNVDSESKGDDLNSTEDGERRKRKKKKKKVSENAETNNDVTFSKDAEKKKRKKKEKCSKIDEEEVTTTPSSSSKSAKKVKFSDQVEVFPSSEDTEESGDEDDDDKEMELVRGKRFTKEEDALVKQAVLDYIENHDLGENGLEMVMNCRSYPEIKGCWKEIESALPWRARTSVYYRAHILFEEGSKGVWTPEDLELVKQFQAKHGNDWKKLADAMGKHRVHVKDAWRRIRLNMNKGHWSMEEYQTLFDLVNTDIKMKAFKEKHSKHGMLRDNIPWMAISDQLGTRGHVHCCEKWYNQLTSPMVKKGIWANVDDYRLLEELTNLDAACIDDVDWDNILENRDGDACRKRWNQMVLHIGSQGSKTFAEQVEILSERYCPDLAEDVEDFDNRPFDPEN